MKGPASIATAVSFTTPEKGPFRLQENININIGSHTQLQEVMSKGSKMKDSLSSGSGGIRSSPQASDLGVKDNRLKSKSNSHATSVTPNDKGTNSEKINFAEKYQESTVVKFNQSEPSPPDPSMEALQSLSNSVADAVVQTRLDGASPSNASSGSDNIKRGFVSRRGGRVGAQSPVGRFGPISNSSSNPSADPDVENDSFNDESASASDTGDHLGHRHLNRRHPSASSPPRSLSLQPRKMSASMTGMSNDTKDVPSLCSSASGLHSASSPESEVRSSRGALKDEANIAHAHSVKLEEGADEAQSKFDCHKPQSITCSSASCSSASENRVASPLQSKELDRHSHSDRNVVFSPGPTLHSFQDDKKIGRTPTKSPATRQFGDILNFDDKLGSPGIFFSPYLPSPSTFGVLDPNEKFPHSNHAPAASKSASTDSKKSNDVPSSNSVKERDRSGGVTPTNFVTDFGKGDLSSASFDAYNVLSWLQSPTATSLFSPGGLISTPRGWIGITPRTPRTPKFNDSAFGNGPALPTNLLSPKLTVGDSSRADKCSSLAPKGNLQHPICFSPLAPTKRSFSCGGSSSSKSTKNIATKDNISDTPINFKDVFASPNPKIRINAHSVKSNEIPVLEDLPPSKLSKSKKPSSVSPKNSSNFSLEAKLADRELLEDEDLSVLLQLAQTTPRTNEDRGNSAVSDNNNKGNTQVFRSQKNQQTRHHSHLQLPLIGKNGREPSPSKLSRKTAFRDHPPMHSDDFTPPPLAIRSCSSSGSRGSREIKAGQSGKGVGTNSSQVPYSTNNTITANKTKSKKGTPNSRKNSTGRGQNYETNGVSGKNKRPASSGQPLPRRPSHQNGASPPPPGIRHNNNYNPPQYHMHAPPPHAPPPPHTAYPHPHPHGYHPGMSGHPPPYHFGYPSSHSTSHPPHHPPYSMYSSPPPVASNVKPGMSNISKKSQTKKSTTKANTKRILIPQAGANKKQKKNSSPKQKGSNTAGRKTQKASAAVTATAAMNNPVDRQKAAAAITAMNAAAGNKNDKAAALAAAILRGVTMRPSGKWQAQLYYAGKSRYIGVFDTREKAALAYEIAREKLKTDKSPSNQSAQSLKETEANVNAARKAAFEGVNEKDPRLSGGK